MTEVETQADTTRDAVLDAAERLFAIEGFHETQMKEVAEAAGVAVGTIYLHVKSKDDLFASVMTRRGGPFVTETMRVVRSDDPPARRLRALAEHQVRWFRQHPEFARLVLWSAGAPIGSVWAEMSSRFSEGYDRAMTAESRLFAEGIDAGAFHSGDPEHLAQTFSAMVQAFQRNDLARIDDGLDPLDLDDLWALLDRAFVCDAGASVTPRRRRVTAHRPV